MQEHESAAGRRCHNPECAQANEKAMPKPARLIPPIPLREELIVKKRNDFVVANLLDAHMAASRSFKERRAAAPTG